MKSPGRGDGPPCHCGAPTTDVIHHLKGSFPSPHHGIISIYNGSSIECPACGCTLGLATSQSRALLTLIAMGCRSAIWLDRGQTWATWFGD